MGRRRNRLTLGVGRWAPWIMLVGVAAAGSTVTTASRFEVGTGARKNKGSLAHHFEGLGWARHSGLRGSSPLLPSQEAGLVQRGWTPHRLQPQYSHRHYHHPTHVGHTMAPPGVLLEVKASPPPQHSSTLNAERTAATQETITRMFPKDHHERAGGSIMAPKFSNSDSTHAFTARDKMRFASSQQKQKASKSADPWWVNPPPWWLPSPPEWGAPPPSVYSPFYSPGTIPNYFQAQAMPSYNPQPAPNQYAPQQYRL